MKEFFLRKRYEGKGFKGGYAADKVLKNGKFLLFRGIDQKVRVAYLTLTKSPKKGASLEESNKTIRLLLSYILSPYNRDILNANDSSVSSN